MQGKSTEKLENGLFRAWQWTYMTSMKGVLTLKLKNSRFSYSEISTLPPPNSLTNSTPPPQIPFVLCALHSAAHTPGCGVRRLGAVGQR